MTYNVNMNTLSIPQVIVESTSYQKSISNIWDENEQTEFKNYIGTNPFAGYIIPGTGGLRKIRWQASGHGKRGGARVIYYIYDENNPLYLLFSYPKNVKANLSETEKKILSTVVNEIKTKLKNRKGD